jgi:glycosyltransferase involved in cell wall biosynthesis
MPELSVIVPFVNEWPQVIFTLRSIIEELDGRVDYEIIAVNNYAQKVAEQKREEDKGGEHVRNIAKLHGGRLKYIKWDEKLSHWNAKNVAVAASTGKFLCFIDAHCIVGRNSLYNMFQLYRENFKELNGTIHLPLTYHILEQHKLIYALQVRRDDGWIHYTFCGYRNGNAPYEVPCMSTCGMMMTRWLYGELDGWPSQLGIYGGGENYMNFVLAVLGYKKWIMPGRPLYHHGEKRGYSYEGGDYIKNQALAAYCHSGRALLELYIKHRRGHPLVLKKIRDEIIVDLRERREYLKSKQVTSIWDWLKGWGE